jgi:hypothetical protein
MVRFAAVLQLAATPLGIAQSTVFLLSWQSRPVSDKHMHQHALSATPFICSAATWQLMHLDAPLFSGICVSDVSCSKQQIDTIVNLAPGGGGGISWTGSSGRDKLSNIIYVLVRMSAWVPCEQKYS